jgi:hyperosmotically inducible periplasmic protein
MAKVATRAGDSHIKPVGEKKNNMKRVKALFIAGFAALLSSTLLTASTPFPDNSSAYITKQVGHELRMLPYYSIYDDLSYKVDGGTVTLYGYVVRPILKSDAENVVKRVEGVEHVVNRVEVLPLSGFDNSIRRRETRAIYGFPSLQRYGLGTQPSIHIIVNNGHVTLTGIVDNQADKNVAYIQANSVPGVFSVTNNLRVANSRG